MNRKIFLTLSVAAVTLFSSCLTGLHNLVNYTNVVSDDRIVGNWQHNNMPVKIEPVPESRLIKNITTMEMDGKEKKSGYDSIEDSLLYSKSYVINFTRDNYHYYMVCCLTKIAGELYADLEPVTAEPVNKPTGEDANDLLDGGKYIESHSIAKIIFSTNQVELRLLNGDFIKKQLLNGSAGIKYEQDNLFNTTIVTSSADNLRQFLSKYGNDERLYSHENTITLKKEWQ